jgi:hypothetical protein
MKKIKVLLLAVLFLSAGSFIQQAAAQEKTKALEEKEIMLQKMIEEQKKAMIDQKAAKAEFEVISDTQQEEMDDLLQDLEVKADVNARGRNSVRVYTPRSGSRSFGIDEPFAFSGAGGDLAFFGHFDSDVERTTLDFSKSVKENTFSKDYTFDVDKTSKSVMMSVNGDCKAGEIRIKIILPNGKNYSEIVIDEFGNLNWRKSFSITETENKDKTGEWKFQVSSTKATGFFRISLQTN